MVGLVEQGMAPPGAEVALPGVGMEAPVDGQTMDQVPLPEEDLEADDGPEADETDPAYQEALRFVADALYRGDAAQSIATQLEKSPNKAETLAEVVYEIASIAAEKLEGRLPPELYMLFTTAITDEVVEIAEMAGVTFSKGDLATSLKQNVLRFLGEMGENTAGLQAAMDQIAPSTFDNMQDDAPVEEGI